MNQLMIRSVVLSLILLAYSGVSQAREGFLWVRGEAWEEFTDLEKLVYVSGVMDGLLVASSEKREEYLPLNAAG